MQTNRLNEYAKIWFTSDTHFGHKNVLKHCPERLKAFGIPEDVTDEEKVRLHDEYLIQLWNGTIGRKDIVYIIGDFSFYNVEKTRKILSRLNGSKFLIIGNHDKSSVKLGNYFQQITHIKEIDFKKRISTSLKRISVLFVAIIRWLHGIESIMAPPMYMDIVTDV